MIMWVKLPLDSRNTKLKLKKKPVFEFKGKYNHTTQGPGGEYNKVKGVGEKKTLPQITYV